MSSCEQVADRVLIFGSIQAMERFGPAGIRAGGRGAIELGLQPRREPVVGGLVRPRPAGRRHEAGAKLPHDLFPDVRVGADIRHVQRVEREPGRLQLLVVAGDAVAIEDGALRDAADADAVDGCC